MVKDYFHHQSCQFLITNAVLLKFFISIWICNYCRNFRNFFV